MDQRTLDVLEFPKILDRLSSFASFAVGKERVRELRPSSVPAEVEYRQQVTREARHLLELRTGVTVGGARDVRDPVRRAQLGGRLEPAELLDVRGTLEAGRTLRRAVLSHRQVAPALVELAEGLPELRELEDTIGRCIDERGGLTDAASPALGRIRAELRTAHARLIERLNSILASSSYKDVIQEPIITMRDGRYVIPIKAEAKGKFRSIVHDQSSSGATLFVEPLLTVDLNNRWRELQLGEQHEIARILLELSQQVGRAGDAILFGLERLGDLDLAFASAQLASMLRGAEPKLVRGRGQDPDREIILVKARHPLLRGEVVPVTVRLGGDFSALVITGPNTGGKTVTLKTVGLLTLMALAGLQIPADEGSQVRIVEAVYADIGDEQSIEQSLSTFSSHMTHIVEILKRCDDGSLVLLDELGAGTDPVEGAALARAILNDLVERGALTIATTHYSELKSYAHTTPGVANASVEFDVETLRPTYRLTIGLPGRSNALAIAARLGLPEPVLERARGLLSQEDVQVERMLSEIHSERERAEQARLRAEKEHRRVADLARQLTKRLSEIERSKRAAVERAHAEAQAELEDLRAGLKELATRIEHGQAPRGDLAPLMQQVRDIERQLVARRPAPPPHPAPTPPRGHPVPASGYPAPGTGAPPAPITPGAWVRVRRLGQVGRVVSLSGSGAEIQVGAFKTRVRLAELEPATRAEAARHEEEPVASTYTVSQPTGPMPPLEIQLLGWRAEQVGPELDRYLNDAYMAGLPFVRIVHGKGTGVLRQVVREHLTGHPLVRSFDLASAREGGEGVTIAALAN
ncbi:MAG TPA: Smr/MutS family protein [Chloroflexota bacterium]|jgi:DNA mismatch repair protein MutS2|nr:Smr/MutS family protein [Chloroflexota bacterium]